MGGRYPQWALVECVLVRRVHAVLMHAVLLNQQLGI
jgi:hypothetical protein